MAKKKNPFQIGDLVKIIKLTPKKKRFQKLYGYNPIGKKGVVTAILGTKKDPCQGVRVRFPWMQINGGNGKKKIQGFESPFYIEEVQKLNGDVKLGEEVKIRYRRGVELKNAIKMAKKLREGGKPICEIARQMGVSERTIFRWLKRRSDI